MRDEKAKLDQAGLTVVLIGMGSPAETEEFRRRYDVVFPFICDPEKTLYAAYGLQQAALQQFASPLMLLKGLQAMTVGHTPGIPKGDTKQLAGTFVVDQDGRFLLQHVAKDISDNVTVATLLKSIQSAL